MTLLANAISIGGIGAALALLLCLASVIQWARYRGCAYHTETGFWALVVYGWACLALGYLSLLAGAGHPFVTYIAHCLFLLGYLSIIVALLRLFSWNSHRHVATP